MTGGKKPVPNLPAVHVFVSYTRRNSAMLTQVVADGLAKRRISNVFVDTRMTDGAGPFPDRLLRAIEACRVFVCLLGETTLDSTWVLREIEYAHQLGKPMIPVFQETYDAAKGATVSQTSPAVAALLNSDGVHILDLKNLHIGASLDDLAGMIRRTPRTASPIRHSIPVLLLGISALGLTLFLLALANSQQRSTTPTPPLATTAVLLQQSATSHPTAAISLSATATEPPEEFYLTQWAGETETTIAQSWTPTQTPIPTDTPTPTPNSAQRAALTGTQAVLNRTATVTRWTKTPTSTYTPSATVTPSNTPTPTLIPAGATLTPTVYARKTVREVALVYVPPGCFQMGSNSYDSEKPIREVCLTRGYYIGEFEITNAQFAAYESATGKKRSVTDSCKAASSAPTQPAVCVSWEEASAYATWLASCALPTEAQWEYAARSPASLMYPWGNQYEKGRVNIDEIDSKMAGGKYLQKTASVGSYPDGKSWVGAHDLSGNVWEWVADWYDKNYYANRPKPDNDPAGPTSGSSRALRGGSWVDNAVYARAADRGGNLPGYRYDTFGFRVVCSAPVR